MRRIRCLFWCKGGDCVISPWSQETKGHPRGQLSQKHPWSKLQNCVCVTHPVMRHFLLLDEWIHVFACVTSLMRGLFTAERAGKQRTGSLSEEDLSHFWHSWSTFYPSGIRVWQTPVLTSRLLFQQFIHTAFVWCFQMIILLPTVFPGLVSDELHVDFFQPQHL